MHTVICEEVLGRQLPAGACVHHVDGNGHNNAHSNLVICQDGAYHVELHRRARIIQLGGNPNTDRYCSSCARTRLSTEFNRRSNGHWITRCRECDAAAMVAWRLKRKSA